MIWVWVLVFLAVCAAFVLGYLTCVLRLPDIIGQMSARQRVELQRRVARAEARRNVA